MSNPVSWTVEATLRPGQADAFRDLMGEMIASTRDGEPGARRYEWFLADDSVHILETYADSDAGMLHLGNLAQKFAERLMGIADITRVCVYGEPTDELRGALAGFGAEFRAPLGGFVR
ncbi:MAG: antibiotic biosynthesis monooxygenase [Planctomycetota bacterium]